MERRVFEAAQQGHVSSLIDLLQHDPLILDRILSNCAAMETPLHVAAMLGHVDFVKEMVTRKPEFTREPNVDSYASPLHLASARGFVDVVRALLSVDDAMCLACDRDGRNPLHIAAIKGRVDVLRELLSQANSPEAIRATTQRGETVSHVCVLHNNLEALNLLVDSMINDDDAAVLFNARDDYDNTILHLAVASKQKEIVEYLLQHTKVEVNPTNLYGLTPLDILLQSPRDMKDIDIRESLSSAGAVTSKDHHQQQQENGQRLIMYHHGEDWLERKRSALMIVASVTATIAFQAAANPPGGVWDETKTSEGKNVGYSIWEGRHIENPANGYSAFVVYNTVGFVSSLTIILLLMSGLPLIRRRAFVCTLVIIMWISIFATALTYWTCLTTVTNNMDTIFASSFILYSWFWIMYLLIGVHSIQFVIRITKTLLRRLRKT